MTRIELGFDAAIKHYQDFLSEHDLSTKILWIFREDVIVSKRRIYLRWPLPSVNSHRMAQIYEQGRNKGLGLRLDTFCLAKKRPCCYFWVPKDETDADYALLSGFKMSLSTELRHARTITNNLIWKVIAQRHERIGCKSSTEEIPQRD